MAEVNRQILLASRPQGAASVDNFRLVETPLKPLANGELRVRNHYLSLDPYMRGRMNDSKSYAQPQPLDEVMIGGTAGEVVESKHPDFAAGDRVVGMFGWQEFGTSDGKGLQKVDTTHVPLSAYLGPVGMPGVTAWYGLNRIIAPKAGETVVVSAATTSGRGGKSLATGIRGSLTPEMAVWRDSQDGRRAASAAAKSTTSPTLARSTKSQWRIPSPRTSISPANSRAGRTHNSPPPVSRQTRSSPTRMAAGSCPERPAKIRSKARRDLPEPDGPRISTARSPTFTADAWMLGCALSVIEPAA